MTCVMCDPPSQPIAMCQIGCSEFREGAAKAIGELDFWSRARAMGEFQQCELTRDFNNNALSIAAQIRVGERRTKNQSISQQKTVRFLD